MSAQHPLARRAVLRLDRADDRIGSTSPHCIAHTKKVDNAVRARAATIVVCSRMMTSSRLAMSLRVILSIGMPCSGLK